MNDEEAVEQVIQKAMDQESLSLPLMQTALPAGVFSILVLTTHRAGAAIGTALVDVVKDKQLDNQVLDTMIMTGYREALNLEERIRGFFAATEGEINLNIRDILENHDTVERAIILLEDYVKNNPDIDVIYFVGGWPFYVPAEALPNFQRWAQKEALP